MLTRKNHTAGNKRRWTLDYSAWLGAGRVPVAFTVVSGSATLTVTGAAVIPDKQCIFFTNGGVADETATVTTTMTDSLGQIDIRTIEFTVAAP